MIVDVLKKLQFLPVTIFILTAKYYDFTDLGWQNGFYAGSLFAILQTIFLVLNNQVIERFLLAVNLFLLGGAFGFLLNSDLILEFYGAHKQVVLFVALIIVGLFTTFSTKTGFLGIDKFTKKETRILSLYLLAASAFALAISIFVKSYGLVTAAILIIALKLFEDYLINNFKKFVK